MLEATQGSHDGRVWAFPPGMASVGVWLLAFWLRLELSPRSAWFARDDAVITLSHARNAALYGTVGVSPGDRVEGFSSPLHFFIAYIIERITGMAWGPLTIVILACGLIVIAVGLQIFFTRLIIERHSVGSLRASQLALFCSTVVALLTVLPWTSVGWMGSGMENPVVVATGMMVFSMACVGKSSWVNAVGLGLLLAAFAVSRVEFAGLVIGIIPVAAWLFADRFDGNRQKVEVFLATITISFGLIAAVHLARRAYFGEWLPNTALVQGRVAAGHGQAFQLALYSAAIAMIFATAAVSRSAARGARLSRWTRSMHVATALIVVFGLAVTLAPGAAAGNPGALLRALVIPALLFAIVILTLVRCSLGLQLSLCGYLAGFIATLPLVQFIIFGPARLGDFRIAILAVPFLGLWLSVSIIDLWMPAHRVPVSAPLMRCGLRNVVKSTTLATTVILTAAAPLVILTDRTTELNYAIEKAPSLIRVVHTFRDNNLEPDGLVLLATPDLGQASFDKSAVITDLGFLGDPVTARLRGDPELLTLFVKEIARPDVIEGHDWLCPLDGWLKSADFAENYELVNEYPKPGGRPNCFRESRYSIWQRTDAGSEIELTNLLLTSTEPVALVEAAIATCVANSSSPFRCQPVRRSVQRAVVVLRRNGTLADVVQAFQPAPSSDLDRLLLLRPPGWGEQATEAFKRLAAQE